MRPAGWSPKSGRQPWIIYNVMRTTAGNSANVSAGEAIFTLIGFVGIYILLGLLFLFLVGKTIAQGPEEAGNPEPADTRTEVMA